MDGVLADGLRGTFELDAVEHGCAAEERLAGDANPGGDGAAEVVAGVVDRIEDGGRAEIDDDDGRAVNAAGGDGIDDAVCAELAGVVVEDADARAEAVADDERLDTEELPADLLEGGDERGHIASDDAGVDLAGVDAADREQGHEHHAVLVGELFLFDADPPRIRQVLAVPEPDVD